MKGHQADHAIATMCRVLGVSPSGYYAWQHRPLAERAQRDAELSRTILTIHLESRGTYGAPRVHAELAAQGIRVSRKRVARLMRTAGVQGVSRCKWVTTTTRDPAARSAPARPGAAKLPGPRPEPTLSRRHHVRANRGRLPLPRGGARCLEPPGYRLGHGHAFANRARADRARHGPGATAPPRGHPSFRSQLAQYTAVAYGERCLNFGVRPSMGSVGDAYDNALCESFFATLECELRDRERFRTPADARRALFGRTASRINDRQGGGYLAIP